LSTSDEIKVGLGNTGNQLAPQLEKNFNIPPTVTVNQGSGVGVLFLKSVTLKKVQYEYQKPQWEKALDN
jgi:intracellular multiplication protein IcmE